MKAVCKLALNQKLIEKDSVLNAEEEYLWNKHGKHIPTSLHKKVCLGCGEEFFTSRKDFIFCSAKCSTEYFKRTRGF